jgi:hypothetical protein
LDESGWQSLYYTRPLTLWMAANPDGTSKHLAPEEYPATRHPGSAAGSGLSADPLSPRAKDLTLYRIQRG